MYLNGFHPRIFPLLRHSEPNGLKQGLQTFVRRPRKLLHNSSRAGHLT